MRLSILIIIIMVFLFLYLYTLPVNNQHHQRSNYLGSIRKNPKLNSNEGSDFDVKKNMGLILRTEVPEKIKMALNLMNAPAVKKNIKIPELPKSFDCRAKWPGLITEPMDQENCGSCWAFAIATSSSDRMRIAEPNHPELTRRTKHRVGNEILEGLNNFSSMHLASCNFCSTSPIGELLTKNKLCAKAACEGQILQVGMQYMKNHGLILSSCDPHTQECIKDRSKCVYDCEINNCNTYKPSFFHQLDDDIAEKYGSQRGSFAQYAVITDGPIIIGIAVYQSMMDFFKDPKNAKKVYSHKVKNESKNDTKLGGHAVVIIGWGTDENGTDFWLIRNSWGRNWADKGYFRIERGINFIGCGDDMWAAHWGKDCKTCIDILLGPDIPDEDITIII